MSADTLTDTSATLLLDAFEAFQDLERATTTGILRMLIDGEFDEVAEYALPRDLDDVVGWCEELDAAIREYAAWHRENHTDPDEEEIE